MTALNVFAAVTDTGEFVDGSVCVDCMFYLANGEVENPDSDWSLERLKANLEIYNITLGHLHSENRWDRRCFHLGSECEDDCMCDTDDFVAYSSCLGCDSTLGGSRHDVIAINHDLLRTKMTQEQFDKLSSLCNRYHAEMRISDYHVRQPDSVFTPGWVESWVGGESCANKTIFVGVAPDGASHS